MMKITQYNKGEAIEMLQARAFLLLMSDEVKSLDGEYAAGLWELVGHMNENEALRAITVWETTQ